MQLLVKSQGQAVRLLRSQSYQTDLANQVLNECGVKASHKLECGRPMPKNEIRVDLRVIRDDRYLSSRNVTKNFTRVKSKIFY